jgi:hypothetical protein
MESYLLIKSTPEEEREFAGLTRRSVVSLGFKEMNY